jgi:hypothetical protein
VLWVSDAVSSPEGILLHGICRPSRYRNPRDLLEIIDKRQVVPRLEHRGDSVSLILANFNGEQAVWFKGDVGLGYEAAVDVEAGFAAEECGGGLVVADLGVERATVGLGDVGRVTDDSVEGLGFLIERG